MFFIDPLPTFGRDQPIAKLVKVRCLSTITSEDGESYGVVNDLKCRLALSFETNYLYNFNGLTTLSK